MQFVLLPLHTIHLESDLVKGQVVVGVASWFPIDGVSLILGNDLAGGKVLLNPEVTAVPISEHPEELEQTNCEIFPVCVVTRAMSEKQKQDLLHDSDIALADSFMTAEEDINFLSAASAHSRSVAVPKKPS